MSIAPQIFLLGLMLLLPLSALVARRLPIGATMKMALAWAAIFTLATGAFYIMYIIGVI